MKGLGKAVLGMLGLGLLLLLVGGSLVWRRLCYEREGAHNHDQLALLGQGMHASRSLSPERMTEYERMLMGHERGVAEGGGTDAYGRPLVYVPYSEPPGYGSITALGRDGKRGGTFFFGLNEDRTVFFDEAGLFYFKGTNKVYTSKAWSMEGR